MFAFTAKSTVYISLYQVGVTVFGVLMAATSQRVASVAGHLEVYSNELLMDLGLAVMVLPLVWISLVSAVRIRDKVSDTTKRSVFAAGFFLLVALIVLAGYAAIRPWTTPMALQEPSWSGRDHANAHFPLTPTLSLREREPHIPSRDQWSRFWLVHALQSVPGARFPVLNERDIRVSDRSRRVGVIDAVRSILPLPEGEGWGEGARRFQFSVTVRLGEPSRMGAGGRDDYELELLSAAIASSDAASRAVV